jgi:hypothetical protein
VPDTGDYVPVGRYLFVLYPAAPGDLDHVIRLVREAAEWLRSIGTDQWQKPWPENRHARLIRIDAWTTNERLHRYYEDRHFTRCRDPQGLGSYPSQALFERSVDVRVLDFTKLFTTHEGQGAH